MPEQPTTNICQPCLMIELKLRFNDPESGESKTLHRPQVPSVEENFRIEVLSLLKSPPQNLIKEFNTYLSQYKRRRKKCQRMILRPRMNKLTK